MATYRPEPQPPATAGNQSRIGVLICNLGTPDAPTAAALRPYLAEFLGDPRVVELSRVLWWPILHGLILRRRPAQSAEKYRSIWAEEGSPLLVWTQRQATLLSSYLGERGLTARVRFAMRYGQPAIAQELDALKAAGCSRILVLPLYPQYAACTTGSVMDHVADWVRSTRHLPELRCVGAYPAHEGYVEALAESVRAHWQLQGGRPDCLLMSFHGIPKSMVERGDPYQQQCERTAHALAARLGLEAGQWQLSYQSRFGRAKWLEPATDRTLKKLGQQGLRRVDVICPGFVSDCLETLEEIAMEGKEIFQEAGGGELHQIPCLNDRPAWISALADLVQQHVRGWPLTDEAAAEPQNPASVRAGGQ